MNQRPGEQDYWSQELGPEMMWDPEAGRLRIEINRKTQRIRYEDENEEGRTVIVIEPKDAPDTNPLKPKASDYR